MGEPSQRVVLQRIRNRRMELCDFLALGNAAVPILGPNSYFNWFFDVFPDHAPLPECKTMTSEEHKALEALLVIMDEACEATPEFVDWGDQLIASGWPERIRPVASHALEILQRRGRYDEQIEETEPSGR